MTRFAAPVVAVLLMAAASTACGSSPHTSANGAWDQCGKVPTPTSVMVRRTVALPQGEPFAGRPVVRREGPVADQLFTAMCRTVAKHVSIKGAVSCPDDFGLKYTGSFHAADQAVGTFTWGASGCQRVTLNVAGHTLSTTVFGDAAIPAFAMDKAMVRVIGVRTVDQIFQPRS